MREHDAIGAVACASGKRVRRSPARRFSRSATSFHRVSSPRSVTVGREEAARGELVVGAVQRVAGRCARAWGLLAGAGGRRRGVPTDLAREGDAAVPEPGGGARRAAGGGGAGEVLAAPRACSGAVRRGAAGGSARAHRPGGGPAGRLARGRVRPLGARGHGELPAAAPVRRPARVGQLVAAGRRRRPAASRQVAGPRPVATAWGGARSRRTPRVEVRRRGRRLGRDLAERRRRPRVGHGVPRGVRRARAGRYAALAATLADRRVAPRGGAPQPGLRLSQAGRRGPRGRGRVAPRGGRCRSLVLRGP